ncbi:acetyl-CoA synthetase [Planococcus donghaensis MPA1U2]|uniref:acetate--CoA ligase n=1 Tax=Planococcus donghaensis MPA1U2 TaxID=933115 RepID=E7RE69_9BACL|nr:acetate--CoA ligase [Planococcus donghaensis]EGA90733.1 acetyl-CoA synthetase [Planococcus donghaensis MPA1U2]
MKVEALPAKPGVHQLHNYEETAANFDWTEVEKEFSWHESGKVNMAHEAIDRHADSDRKNKVALYYKDQNRNESYTFYEMKRMTNRAANLLKANSNLEKGDRIFIFMPRSPELYFLMFGALKMGLIVGPLFEAFMEGAIYDRLDDSEAKSIITTPELLERVPYDRLPNLETIFLVGDDVEEKDGYIDVMKHLPVSSDKFEIEWLDKEDGLVLHYTSGSTGKPKGVLHAQYAMVQQYQTGKWVLDFNETDIYWCTADPGWVTGTAYGVFSPWLNGVTTVILGGRFSPEGWYQAIEDFGVTVWYSAPTAFRMLMGAGDALVKEYDLSTLRHVLSVGEPLNPEVVRWGAQVFDKRIHDTWWMTETGAQTICNFPSMTIKPGSMGKPVPGLNVAIVDDQGNELPPNQMGNLAIEKGWPSMMRQIWNNPAKYDSYFLKDKWYVSGDSAYMDEEGYFWFQGRVDDVIMTSGERVGPFEVESKLLEHPAVAEAGVIGKPDPVRGEIIKAFVALVDGYEPSEELVQEIQQFVKKGLAAHAAPREIEFKDKLPKTRSGKIMRRVLKAWELDLPAGDLSTMED